MSVYTELPVLESAIPIPPAYQRYPSYPAKNDPFSIARKSNESDQTDSRKSVESWQDDKNPVPEKLCSSINLLMLRILKDSRMYARILAILVIIVSIFLILSAVILFENGRKNQKDFDSIPKAAPITIQPCIIFASIATLNLAISIALLAVSSISSKFRKSQDAVNATFAIVAAIGFSTSMGACFYLNTGAKLKNDLWKWSCANDKSGIQSNVINFHNMCNIINLSWIFGLIQAGLELFTLGISIIAFILLKYKYFINYGRIGKIF
ncbi:hypothetical protein GcM3_182016 [Golovinomyces cichoracearum]|uniref:Uncharacterized protein n=1 Tax=Golovinomyces cichoracearum TaxID=62708 RepID=A0A420HLY0_9PEZI|nr:hypothetical protein GcM3_182016 [Golovinomyces cichoracearum]